jgi:hypothetical protein
MGERYADASGSFISQYIFPGGYLPSVTQLLNHITAESAGTLIVEKVENIGGHYARALRLWREKFLANFEDKIRPALMKEHPGMREEEVEVFRRKWEVRVKSIVSRFGHGADKLVLLLVLRSRLLDQDARRRHHHCWERGRHGADGGYSPLDDDIGFGGTGVSHRKCLDHVDCIDGLLG